MKGRHSLLEWVEAGTLITAALTAAVAVSAVTLYRLDSLENKVDDLISTIATVRVIKRDVDELKNNEGQTLRIFEKFSDSVDRLAISVAKLEAKVDMIEVGYGKAR